MENNEIRDLVNEVQQKLNLPEDATSGLNQEAKWKVILVTFQVV